eukprot:Selendium_serpulae@DN5645_c0_g2_i3.p1
MLEVTLAESSFLKRLIQALREVLVDVRLEFLESGVRGMMLDPSRVALVNVHLCFDNFEFYRCDVSGTSVGLNLTELHKMLSAVPNNERVTLRKEDNDDKLSIITVASGPEGGHREAHIKLTETSGEEFEVPEEAYTCMADLPCKMFTEMIKSFDPIAEDVTVTASGKSLSFQGENDLANLNVSLGPGEGLYRPGSDYQFTFEGDGVLEQEYSMKYLSKFCKGAVLSDKVILDASGVPFTRHCRLLLICRRGLR